ncbi:hypothetical protein [Achromobacter sp.]|uniref:hypothetical protein n=1 Tax=Achromobacter sp. TaxID=134375 RepID=UPI0028AF9AE1|nr:hypothetical protein [Achromobacter sp.]
MQTLSDYLDRTNSAAQILFDGLQQYRDILESAAVEPHVTSYRDDADLDRQVQAWCAANESAIARQREAFKNFAAETFSQATLAGSILQIASAAIEQYGSNRTLDSQARQFVHPKKSQFWAGRVVRGLPLGAVILAGRNQHMHSSEADFNPSTRAAFEYMALAHGTPGFESTPSAGLDLCKRDRNNPLTRSFAHNILSLTGWKAPFDMRRDLVAIIDR